MLATVPDHVYRSAINRNGYDDLGSSLTVYLDMCNELGSVD